MQPNSDRISLISGAISLVVALAVVLLVIDFKTRDVQRTVRRKQAVRRMVKTILREARDGR